MHCASELHLKAAKTVERYINETVNYGVKYYMVQEFKLYGFSGSDWAGSLDDMKSASEYYFSMSSGFFFLVFKEAKGCSSIHSRS